MSTTKLTYSSGSPAKSKHSVRVANSGCQAYAVFEESGESGDSFDYSKPPNPAGRASSRLRQSRHIFSRCSEGVWCSHSGVCWSLAVEEGSFRVIAYSGNAPEMLDFAETVEGEDDEEIMFKVRKKSKEELEQENAEAGLSNKDVNIRSQWSQQNQQQQPPPPGSQGSQQQYPTPYSSAPELRLRIWSLSLSSSTPFISSGSIILEHHHLTPCFCCSSCSL